MPAEIPDTSDALAITLRDSYPDAPLPTGFEERLIRRLVPPARSPLPRRVAFTLAAGALGTAAFLGTRAQTPNPPFVLKKMLSAFRKVTTIHMVEHDGALKRNEFWFSRGWLRQDYSLGDKLVWTRIYAGGISLWIHDAEKYYIKEPNYYAIPSPVQPLTTILRRIEKAGLHNAIDNLGMQQIDGKQAQVVKITLPRAAHSSDGTPEELNYTLFIDPRTHLPFRIERRRTEFGHWVTDISKITYYKQIPDNVFTPSLKGYPHKNLKAESYARWKKLYLNPNHPLKSAAGVTVHSFEVMDSQNLLVWFTTDTNQKAHIALNGKGNTCPLLAQGTIANSAYTVAGKQLQWAYFQQNFVASMGSGDWELTVSTGQNSKIIRPRIDELYSSALPQCEPADDIRKLYPKLAGERCRDRGEYFLDGRWQQDARLVELAARGELDPHEKAIFWFRQAIREDGPTLHIPDWLRIAACYDALDRPADAAEYRSMADLEERAEKK